MANDFGRARDVFKKLVSMYSHDMYSDGHCIKIIMAALAAAQVEGNVDILKKVNKRIGFAFVGGDEVPRDVLDIMGIVGELITEIKKEGHDHKESRQGPTDNSEAGGAGGSEE